VRLAATARRLILVSFWATIAGRLLVRVAVRGPEQFVAVLAIV
jgi:hypothetical protein